MTARTTQLSQWVTNQLGCKLNLDPIQGDASFRHYYRVIHQDVSYIAVDSPPDTEDNDAFVALTIMLQRQGILVPEVLSFQKEKGFMLLTDLGQTLLLDVIDDSNMVDWYQKAFLILRQIQLCPVPTGYPLPNFDDAFVAKECHYFSEWCVEKLLGITLTKTENKVLLDLYAQCQTMFKQQPHVLTHRDFHSRNLMVLPTTDMGLIDYQDAIMAPITYDLASLLKDCYVMWPKSKRIECCKLYYQMLIDEKMCDASWDTFYQWFDWVGLQRHIKVLGIFSRLKIRDNKQSYLADTPRIMEYIKDLLPEYDSLGAFESLLFEKIMPEFKRVWQQSNIEQFKEQQCEQ